ncbi:MAG TPA: substrate-binding domain-containing protein, partial [Candidatus Limnocylindrales bacterium]|nr:substrate-binding domain-containing protein [Candidatus Limnocylindrales bacterium]
AAPSSSPVAAAETEPSTVPPLLAQEIRLDALPDMVWGDPKVLLPYAASSGLPVTWSARGACDLIGTGLILVGAGTCTVAGSQPGDATWAPAADVTRTFAVTAVGSATLRLDPSAPVVSLGDTLSVRLVVSGSIPLSGVQAAVPFDASRLRLVGIGLGSDWSAAGAMSFGFPEPAAIPAYLASANAVGKVASVGARGGPYGNGGLAAALVATSLPASTDLAFLDLTFEATSCGTARLRLPVGRKDGYVIAGISKPRYGYPTVVSTGEAAVEVVDCPPPAAPTMVSVTGRNGAAVVAWSPATGSGTSPVTGYTVTATPGGRSCTWAAGPLRCVVAGLDNERSYTFSVTATSVDGTSPASVPSDAVTPSRTACPSVLAVEGAAALLPAIRAVRAGFEEQAGGCRLAPAGSSHEQAIADLVGGAIDVAALSRPLSPSEREQASAWHVGSDAMVFIVADTPAMDFLDGLTTADVEAIYRGGLPSWALFGGPGRWVVPRSYGLASEERASLLRLFPGVDAASEASSADATGLPRLATGAEAAAEVAAHPYQLAYVGMADAARAGLRILSLDGVVPTQRSVQTGRYGATIPLFLAVRKVAVVSRIDDAGVVRGDAIVDYLASAAGQAAVAGSGLVPVPVSAAPPFPAWDVNLDGIVAVGDLGIITGRWGRVSTCPGWLRADANADGAVAIADIGLVASHWARPGYVEHE